MLSSNEMSLIHRIHENFEKLDLMEQGGIMYIKIALDEMFYVTQDVMAALQDWLNTTK